MRVSFLDEKIQMTDARFYDSEYGLPVDLIAVYWNKEGLSCHEL